MSMLCSNKASFTKTGSGLQFAKPCSKDLVPLCIQTVGRERVSTMEEAHVKLMPIPIQLS